jgi:hypothetical protein
MIQTKWLFSLFLLINLNLTTNLLFAQNDTLTIIKKTQNMAQDETEYEYDTVITKRKIKKQFLYPDYKKGDLDFYLSPLAFLEPCATAYFGVEYFLKNKISIHTDIGYILNFRKNREVDNNIALPHSAYPSYVIKPEIRFYTKNNPQKASYHAIKFMFRNMNYKEDQFVYDEYFFDQNSQSWTISGEGYQSDYRVRRRSIGIQYIKGWKGRFAKSWINNFYFGVGVRYISNKPIDKRPTPFNSNWEEWSIDFLELDKQYKFISMDIALGLRIGTKLKKR